MAKHPRFEGSAALRRRSVRPDYIFLMDDVEISRELAEQWLGMTERGKPARARAKANRPRARTRRLVLVALEGFRAGLCWEFDDGFIIGRGSDMDLPLDDASVCRNHAEIFPTANGWEVSDLGSFHGTLLNGGRLEPGAWPLLRRDILSVGNIKLFIQCCE